MAEVFRHVRVVPLDSKRFCYQKILPKLAEDEEFQTLFLDGSISQLMDVIITGYDLGRRSTFHGDGIRRWY